MSSGAEQAPQWPRFRWDEVVRIAEVGDWQRGEGVEVGTLGRVTGFTPGPPGSRLVVTVDFANDTYGHYWEHQLVSCGLVEVDAEDGPLRDRLGNPVKHVPLPPSDPETEFAPKLLVGFLIDASAEPLEAALARARDALTAVVPEAEINGSGDRDETCPGQHQNPAFSDPPAVLGDASQHGLGSGSLKADETGKPQSHRRAISGCSHQ